MRRTFVIGDIHGGLKALQQVLERAPISNNDQLIFLGDYVDGWSESPHVISFLIELRENFDCVFVKGNHDKWCEEWLRTQNADSDWLFHGGHSTVDSYQKIKKEKYQEHLNFFETMVNYYVDDKNRLFIHAGFSSMHGVEKEPYESNYSWDRTLWELALVMKETNLDVLSPFYPKRFKHYTEIFIGHTPTTNYDIGIPMQASIVNNLDTGAAFKGKLTIMDIDTKEFWQSDPLPSLYSNEKGRN